VEWLTEFGETWSHPAMRHALLVHWPIVLGIIAVPLIAALAITTSRSIALRLAALAAAAAVVVATFMAQQSGERAESAAEGALSADADAALHEHEELGDAATIAPMVMAGLVALSFIRLPVVRVGAPWLALGCSLFGAAWIAKTAHHGGTLVYVHGVGAAAGGAAGPDGQESPAAAPPADPRLVHFREAVLPVLRDRCWKCHNPVRMNRSGKLDQTTITSLLAGGESGAAVVPGRTEASVLYQRITAANEDDVMPPTGRLPQETIDAVAKWISGGAVWDETIVPPIATAPRPGDEDAEDDAD
jgi:uncharacterized membrane protein